MFRFLKSFLLLVILLNVLLVIGLAVFAVATGRLDRAKAAALVALLRHKGTPPHLRKAIHTLYHPPKPVAAPAAKVAAPPRFLHRRFAAAATATQRLRLVRLAMAQSEMRRQQAAQQLRLEQNLLARKGRQLAAEIKKIAAEKKALAARLASAQNAHHSSNFKKSLAIYRHMQPQQLKKIFMGLPPQQVARYLQAMGSARAAKIVAQFTSRRSAPFIRQVMALVHSSGTSSAIPPLAATGTGGANAGQSGPVQ